MSKVKLHQGEWVVVCDGAKALVLENVGDDKFPNLKTKEVFQQPDAHEAGKAEPSSRSFSSGDTVRHVVDPNDLQGQEEERFLANLVHRLDAAVQAGEVKKLVIAAPPKALGRLRQAYTHGIKNALAAELDKDLVRMPVHEIEKHLAA